MIKLNLKNKKGFTLLEALVAISILMVAVTAPITIAQKGLSSAVYSKDQMIASYLAQDALEYVKNKRDEVAIGNNFDWEGLDILTECSTDAGCQIDTLSGEINPYNSSFLLKDDTNKFYGYGTGDPTKFTRQIRIELHNIVPEVVTEKNEALVTVTVRWGSEKELVTVKTLIYNF